MPCVAALGGRQALQLRGPGDLVSWWSWDVASLVLAAVLVAGYGFGVRAVRRRGLGWRKGRGLAWYAGCACLVLVTVGPAGAYAHRLLSVYSVQVLTLLVGVPVLLAYGRPLALAADAVSDTTSLRLLSVAAGRACRVFTSPLVGPILVPVLLVVVFFTPLLTLALVHGWIYQAEQLVLLLLGFLVAIGIVGDGSDRQTSLGLATAVAVGLGELLLDAIPGIVMRLRTHLLAQPRWAGLHRTWGPSPLHDQQLAGAIVWFVAEAADLPFLFVLTRRWIRVDEREAIRIDRELDRQRREVPGLGSIGVDASSPSPSPGVGAIFEPPWWETDPDLLRGHPIADHYRNRGIPPSADQSRSGPEPDAR